MATVKEVMGKIDTDLKADADKVKAEIDGTFKFILTGDEEGTWLVNCKDDVGATAADGDADCTLTLTSGDFVAIYEGELDGMQAFMTGQIEVDGDMALSMKLQEILS